MPVIGANGPAEYNQKFLELPKYFDTFISERNRVNPNIFINRIPRGALTPFEGLVRQVNIFHGPVGEQSGLSNFRRIQQSRIPNGADPGVDACAVQPKTFGYGWEGRQYTGYTGEWESESICIADISYTHQARQQAEMIAMTVPKVTLSVWETWNRETWLRISVEGGNAFILARDGQDLSTTGTAQYEYDPYATRDFGNGEPEGFLRYPASVQPGALDWSHLTWWQDYLGEECPDAALAVESGYPMFGLMLHLRDFEEMIRNDADLRQDFREARPEVLIDGYPGAFKKYRGYILIHDARQARFKIVAVETEDSVDYVVARRVKPMKDEAVGLVGTVPEVNKEYQSAELAVGLIFMNEIVQNLVPTPIGNLAKDMVFGTTPGYNGEFTWINEYDKQTNPLKQIGNYFAQFKIFPKPLMYHNRATTFLYSRCPHTNGRDCAKLPEDVTGVTSSTLSVDLAATDISEDFILTAEVADVLSLEIGQQVTITSTGVGAGDYSGYIVGTLSPTTIQVGFNPTVGATVVTNILGFDTGDTVALG